MSLHAHVQPLACVLAWGAKTCDVHDTLAALERRCMSAETALHGAVNHRQVIEIIRSIFGQFQEQVGSAP